MLNVNLSNNTLYFKLVVTHRYTISVLCVILSKEVSYFFGQIDLQIQNGYRQHTNGSVFMNLNYSMINFLKNRNLEN